MIDPAVVGLVGLLRSRNLRSRTAILLLPPEYLGEEDLAARLNIDALDYAALVRQSLPPGTRFLGIDARTEVERLDAIATSSEGRDCVLIYNIDLILAKLDTNGRNLLWSDLRERFPYRPRALLLALPAQAMVVQPDGEEREHWKAAGRLVRARGPLEGYDQCSSAT